MVITSTRWPHKKITEIIHLLLRATFYYNVVTFGASIIHCETVQLQCLVSAMRD